MFSYLSKKLHIAKSFLTLKTKSLIVSLVLTASILIGVVAFQVTPNLIKSVLNDTPTVSASPTCPSGYTLVNVSNQCVQVIPANGVYNCPTGSTLSGNICTTTLLDKVGIKYTPLLNISTPGVPFNSCPAGTDTPSTLRTIGYGALSDGSQWEHKICIDPLIFSKIKFIYTPVSTGINLTPCPNDDSNVESLFSSGQNSVTSNVINTPNQVRICLPTSNLPFPVSLDNIVIGNGSCPAGYTDRGSTFSATGPSTKLCLTNTNKFTFQASGVFSCTSGYVLGSSPLSGTNPGCTSTVPPNGCTPGEYLSAGSCTICPPNTYCTGLGNATPAPCPSGQFAPAGSSTLGACSANSYSINKKYSNSPTPSTLGLETENLTGVVGGDIVNAIIRYDNSGGQSMTNAQIKDTLPAGFTYVPGSMKNCMEPTQTVGNTDIACDNLNASQKDAMFANLIGSGVGTLSGLYDSPVVADSSLLFGKRRYMQSVKCDSSKTTLKPFDIFADYFDNSSTATQTDQNCIDRFTNPLISKDAVDTLNKRYMQVAKCGLVSGGNEIFSLIFNNVSTPTADNTFCTNNGLGASSTGNSIDSLDKRYMQFTSCNEDLFGANYNNIAVATTTDSDCVAFEGAGSVSSGKLAIDTLDTTRGKGFMSYKMTAPLNVSGTFGTSVALKSSNQTGANPITTPVVDAFTAGTGNSITIDLLDTTITSNPTNPSNSNTPTFTFTSTNTNAGTTFECRVDNTLANPVSFKPCTSPFQITPALSDGSHTFEVRARDIANNVDQTPASYTWIVNTVPPPCTNGATNPVACNSCPAGNYFNSTNSTCTTCPAGSACTGTTTPPTLCLAGTSAIAGQTTCTTCPINTFCPGTGNPAPTACPTGQLSPAGSTLASSCLSPNGGVIVITPKVLDKPEVFDNISDPYECGKSITGKVTSNYGIKSVIVKLFVRRGDGSYEAQPKYIFRPTLDANGDYEIKIDYNNFEVFTSGEYKVEYSSNSNTETIKSNSYLANVTNQCSTILPIIKLQSTEITPEDKVTVRTGGGNEIYYIALVTALAIAGYIKLKRKNFRAADVFKSNL